MKYEHVSFPMLPRMIDIAPLKHFQVSSPPLSIQLKSRTLFRTFDIMLRLPSRTLNSISCVFATVHDASILCIARSAVLSRTRTSWKTYDVRRHLESAPFRSLTSAVWVACNWILSWSWSIYRRRSACKYSGQQGIAICGLGEHWGERTAIFATYFGAYVWWGRPQVRGLVRRVSRRQRLDTDRRPKLK